MSGKQTFNKSTYDAAYIRENIITKKVLFNRRKPEDMALLEHAESKGNFNAYIHDLIQEDLGKAGDTGKAEDPGKQD